MASNLPPGVTESMIPGNRPEDAEEEAFWDVFCREMAQQGVLGDWVDGFYDENTVVMRFIMIARDVGYAKGFGDGRAEEQMEQAMQHTEEGDV